MVNGEFRSSKVGGIMNTSTMTVFQKKAAIKWELKVERSGKGFYKKPYSTLEDIQGALQPLLKKYNCDVDTNFLPEKCVGTFICLDSGEVMETELPMPSYIQEHVDKDVPATAGSYITYFRRYILLVMFDITERDLIEEGDMEEETPKEPKKEVGFKLPNKDAAKENYKPSAKIKAPEGMEDLVKYARKHHSINTTKAVLNISVNEMQEKGLLNEKEFKKISNFLSELDSKDMVVL